MGKIRSAFPLLDGDYTPPEPIPAPSTIGAAIFHFGCWTVWRVGGTYTLYERRPFKVRRFAGARPSTLHFDQVPIGDVMHYDVAACGICPNILTDARSACAFHLNGLT